MRISDWSSDVCSSDLLQQPRAGARSIGRWRPLRRGRRSHRRRDDPRRRARTRVAHAVSLHSLPLFVRLAGTPVILLGSGAAAEAKRRLLDRAGAIVVEDHPDARLAIVAIEDENEARAAVDRLRARGVLVNAVDRPDWCDVTMPAIVDRDPVLIAIGPGGASAGMGGEVRQRFGRSEEHKSAR